MYCKTITTIIVYVVQKNRAYILVGEMVLRKIMPLDLHGTMTEIPETRRTNGCVLIVVSLKLALRFLPFWSLFVHTRERSGGRANNNSFSLSQICCTSDTLQNYFETYFITLKSY